MKKYCESKSEHSLLGSLEIKLINSLIPLVPSFIGTYHLTLMTVGWSILVLIFGYLAKTNLNWLWAISLIIFLQYITDILDGAIGRHRKENLVKWGYYMDHFLDYFFSCSLIMAYLLISPKGLEIYFIILLSIITGYMIHSFLFCAVSGRFEMHLFALGPTEARILLIITNIVIISVGVNCFKYFILPLSIILLLVLVLLIYRTQKRLRN